MRENKTLAIYGIQDCNTHQTISHDHNICLMHNGKVEKFIQLERLTRVKRDNKLHIYIDNILRANKLINNNFDLVFVDNILGRAFINKEGNIRFEAPLAINLANKPEEGFCYWYGIQKKAWVLNHELAHIGTCLPFFGEFNENSLLVHFDGGASKSNFSAWVYKNKSIEKIESHWNHKWLSSLFNANAFVFSVIGAKLKDQNSVPGKIMGLAGHGTPRKDLETWLRNNNFFENIWQKPSIFFEKAKKDFNQDIKSFNQHNQFIKDCIATIHEIFVRETVQIFSDLKLKTNTKYLYYSGGSALNIVANTRIIEANIFEDVFIPPCCEDSGLALGAAAFVEWLKHDKIKIHKPYLNNIGLGFKEEIDVNEYAKKLEEIADKLSKGEILAICNKEGEAGPRALGNRSLIARADNEKLAKKLSMEYKGREWYRPLAPMMLEKNTKYFTGKSEIHHLSKFMLLDFAILPEKQLQLQGAINKDNTARIQTLFLHSDNPFMWDLLTILDEKYNIKALINTSFNLQGEPIVHTKEDAQSVARKLGLELILI